jgi:putative redox protein
MRTNYESRIVENASATLEEDMHFVGDMDGYRVDLEPDLGMGGTGAGARPLRLVLLGVAGCTAMDMISILRKKRQRVRGLEVEVRGRRVDEHPKVYDEIEIVYRVRSSGVDPKAVERAVELSETRYCPAIAMIGEAAKVTNRYEIEEDG